MFQTKLLVWCAAVCVVFGTFQISVVKDPDSKLFLKYDFPVNKTLRLIPDETTVKELGFDVSSVNGISSSEISNYQVGKPVESLIPKAINPDEILRVAIQRADAMMPLKFTKFQKFGYFNPCVVEWNGRCELLFFQRYSSESFLYRILMAWAMASFHNGVPVESNPHHKGQVRFAWLERGSYTKESNETLFGFGPNFFLAPDSELTRFYEDPRLMVLKNNSLLVTYAAIDLHGGVSFRKVIYNIIKHTNGVAAPLKMGEITRENEQNYAAQHSDVKFTLEEHRTILGFNEKNWITFEYDSKVYYIRNVNPLHISEVTGSKDGIDVVTKVLHNTEEQKVKMPWHKAYIEHTYRGSTPAILVNGVYLAFFHTRSIIQTGTKRFTYFQGAFTFCPKPPFHVHSMSPYPILSPALYDGPWLVTFYDYIVYPAGIVDDGENIVMSAGYQMRDMLMFTFNKKELFESMTIVRECDTA